MAALSTNASREWLPEAMRDLPLYHPLLATSDYHAPHRCARVWQAKHHRRKLYRPQPVVGDARCFQQSCVTLHYHTGGACRAFCMDVFRAYVRRAKRGAAPLALLSASILSRARRPSGRAEQRGIDSGYRLSIPGHGHWTVQASSPSRAGQSTDGCPAFISLTGVRFLVLGPWSYRKMKQKK